jgi:hypothetical protein
MNSKKIASQMTNEISSNWRLHCYGGKVAEIKNGIDCVHREIAKTEDEAARRIISFLEGIRFYQQLNN